MDHNKLWKILKEMGIPDHLTCLLRNLYVKAVYCHSAYLTYMQSTSCQMLDEAQAGLKIAGRNINNLRYTDDTTLMAENKEELKSLWM